MFILFNMDNKPVKRRTGAIVRYRGRQNSNTKKPALLIAALALMAVAFVLAAGSITSKLESELGQPATLLAWQMPVVRGMQVEWQEDEDAHQTTASAASPDITIEPLQADEDVSDDITLELLGSQESGDIELSGDEPQVLIYHTHTTEAYRQTAESKYKESSSWRTADTNKNIVRVGEELAIYLRSEYGINVIHDTTNHEPPKLGTSYERSLKTMEEYKKKYPSIKLYIDVHRDAYSGSGGENDYITINGEKAARMMFVVGTGEGKTGQGFSVKPDFKSNYQLALRITNEINKLNEDFMRPIRVKTGRYNQHVANNCLLVEVGHNMNTLEQALVSVKYLAKAIAATAGL